MCGRCKKCKYWNDFEHTYVKADECCSYWHVGYYFFEDAGNRVKDCFVPKIEIDYVQLTINFDI